MRRIYVSFMAAILAVLGILIAHSAVGAGIQPLASLPPGVNVLVAQTTGMEGYQRKLPPTPGSIKVANPDQNFHPTACLAPVVNVSARPGNEDETYTVVNPTNPNNIVVFSNVDLGVNSIFRGYSTDGGVTWTRGTVATNAACCDGQAVFDSFGNLFLVYINGSVNAIDVLLSTDGGATFAAPVVAGNGSIDQPSIAVGNGSVWVDWNSSNSMVARGAPVTGLGTWGPFGAMESVPSASGSFGGITVGPGPNGGKVMVTYQDPTGGQGPATIYVNVDADGLGAGGFGPRITVTNTNVGGFDFIPAQNGRSIDAEAGLVWDSTGGTYNDRVYLVYTEEPVNESNDTEIYLRTSTDDGATWTPPVRVNDDPMGPIRSQFLPYIALDHTTGTVALGWYDARNDNGVPGSGGTNNIPNDDAEYYASYSTDGGATWAANTLMSGGFSNAADAAAPVDYGDYLGQDATAGKFYTVWADNTNCDGTNANGTLHQFDLYMGVLNLPAGGTPTPTVTGTPPTATHTNTPTITPTATHTNTPTITPTATGTSTPTATPASCGAGSDYSIATATGTIVAGTADTGNHCDDCNTQISLPFNFSLYDQTFSNAFVDSDGNLGFVAADDSFTNTCLPDAIANYDIFPYWDDLCTGPCGVSTCTGCGVFTSVSGTAPNRIFNIEWRADYYNTNTALGFEVRLYQNSPTGQFDIVYGTVPDSGANATVGVQKGTGILFTQYECNTGGLTSGLLLTFTEPPCASPTAGPSSTATPTSTTPPTDTAVATSTPVLTQTPVDTDTPTTAPTSAATDTPVNTVAPTDTSTPVGPTPTACAIQFTDVRPGSTFYQFIHCLVCLGIVNGYPNGTFRPNADVTRGQLSKIVANSAGFNDTPSGQQFQDVPPTGPDSTFYVYIYRLVHRGYISGYPCGGPGEPCVPPDNLPYFRPNASATRGQISKIISNAAGYNETPTGQQFQDVPAQGPGSTFYVYIYRLVHRGIINGYACGSVPQEPCVPPDNLPYFRPNNDATRGQMSKIDGGGFFPDCNIAARSDR